MADRDKYGNYVNDEGVTIKITTDKRGNDHVSFYGGEVDKPHDAAHVNVNYDKGTWDSTTHGPDKSDTSSGSGGCYLTSACMKYFQENFNDNCYELTLLRWFRDNFVLVNYCVQQIERGNYDKAYSRYKNSVLALEEQFARPVLEQRLVKTLKLVR